MISSDVQNEILELQAHFIIRLICEKIRETSQIFSVIVDGTQDVTGMEQESICIRYVDENLNSHEQFMGMYEAPDKTGKTIASIVQDTLLRFNLPIAYLRGQTYDGAANMSGAYHGCQSEIKIHQPLALYVHCGAHCCNLVALHCTSSVVIIRDCLQWVQELGNFYGASGKYKKLFAAILNSEKPSHFQPIKPLCPTRWLTRCTAIKSVLTRYRSLLLSLDEATESMSGESGVRAKTLFTKFQMGETMLGLEMALPALELLESLNKSCQDSKTCVSGMLQAVNRVKQELDVMRDDDYFTKLFNRVLHLINEYNLDEIKMPRRKQPPLRFIGKGEAYHATNLLDHYRRQYYEYIDSVKSGLFERFDSNDLKQYQALEHVLLHVQNDDVLEKYTEFERQVLLVQLQMFKNVKPYASVTEAAKIMQEIPLEVRKLFPQVERLIRLLMVSPASSAEAERSFSSLRRLKTWLRSTIKQKRLNAVAVCHAHQDILDSLDMVSMEKEFISRSDIRKNLFGKM